MTGELKKKISTHATGLVQGIIPVSHLDLSLCVIPNLHRNEKNSYVVLSLNIMTICCVYTQKMNTRLLLCHLLV